MTEQEKINFETNLKLALQDAKFAVFMHELKEQREDIRRAREKHDEDIKEINTKIDSTNSKIDAKFDILSNQIQNLTVAAVVGFGAIALALVGLVVVKLK